MPTARHSRVFGSVTHHRGFRNHFDIRSTAGQNPQIHHDVSGSRSIHRLHTHTAQTCLFMAKKFFYIYTHLFLAFDICKKQFGLCEDFQVCLLSATHLKVFWFVRLRPYLRPSHRRRGSAASLAAAVCILRLPFRHAGTNHDNLTL